MGSQGSAAEDLPVEAADNDAHAETRLTEPPKTSGERALLVLLLAAQLAWIATLGYGLLLAVHWLR